MMQLNLEPTRVLSTIYHRPKYFFVVGAGGTGSYFIPNLIRQISITNKIRKMEGFLPHQVILIDGDQVSESNLNRQNFIRNDLGEYKAEVLANRYGSAFGITVPFLNDYVTSSHQFMTTISSQLHFLSNDYIPVIVECVDNNKTRFLIHSTYQLLSQQLPMVYSISSGNEELTGQVVCGFKYNSRHYSNHTNDVLFNLPAVGEMFPEVLLAEDKLPTELSCDEAAVSSPQNIMTNITAANHLFNFANNILMSRKDDEQLPGLRHFAVTFDLATGSSHTYLTKSTTLARYTS